jgi:hypothetical protein
VLLLTVTRATVAAALVIALAFCSGGAEHAVSIGTAPCDDVHGFDLENDDRRSREIIKRTLAFFTRELGSK